MPRRSISPALDVLDSGASKLGLLSLLYLLLLLYEVFYHLLHALEIRALLMNWCAAARRRRAAADGGPAAEWIGAAGRLRAPHLGGWEG